jgi:hypothetical protein
MGAVAQPARAKAKNPSDALKRLPVNPTVNSHPQGRQLRVPFSNMTVLCR